MHHLRALILGVIFAVSLTVPLSLRAVAIQPTGLCTDAKFLAQLSSDVKIFNGLGKALARVDTTAASYIAFAKLRYQLEDLSAPAGCETALTVITHLIGTTGDLLALNLAGLADTADSKVYGDFVSSTVLQRVTDLNTSATTLLIPASSSTTPATPQVRATASAATCTDPSLVKQVATDFAVISPGNQALKKPGDLIIQLIKIRYRDEDLTPPTGCEAVLKALAFGFNDAEDLVVGTLAGQADTANISVYNDFISARNSRDQALTAFLAPFLATLPQPVATVAATASQP